jgi:beta-glucanase (GH16 family)
MASIDVGAPRVRQAGRARRTAHTTLATLAAATALGAAACSSDANGIGATDGGPREAGAWTDAGSHPPPGGDSGAHHDAGATNPTPDAGAPDASAADAAASSEAGDPSLPGWTLTWSDEFDLPDGSGVDTSKWTQETGNSGWGYNHERQYYTPGTQNAVIQGGSLVITATTQGASSLKCEYGTCEYTSARMNTQGKFSQKYGRFEARIQLPAGQGMWPAFWILGDDIDQVSWPQCGEVDIMENVGSTPSTNYGSLHGPGYSGGQDITGSYTMKGGTLADGYHVYALEWDASGVKFYFDDVNYETRGPADVPAGDTWVYDHPFFVILNLAVGGYWPGDPDSSTKFPQTMRVDYVRVYSKGP